MSAMMFQDTGVSIVYLPASSVTDQRKLQISASLAFVRGIQRWTYYGCGHDGVLDDMIVVFFLLGFSCIFDL